MHELHELKTKCDGVLEGSSILWQHTHIEKFVEFVHQIRVFKSSINGIRVLK
jgi:hypothetical protein